jgi:hypothetical protein
VKHLRTQPGVEAPDDAELVAVFETSGVVRGIERVADAVSVAGRGSVVLTMVAAARREWLRQSAVDRTRRAGIALISAATVHLMLVLWQGPLPGWLWLVVPALAVAFGALMVVAPARGLARERHP